MRDETMCAKCQHPAHDDICAVGDTEWECGCSNVTAPAPRGDAPRAEPKLLRGAAEIDAAFAAAGIPKHDLRATFGSRPPAPRDDAAGGDETTKAIIEQLRAFAREHLRGGCKVLSLGDDCPCNLCAVDNLAAALATERAAHERTKAAASSVLQLWDDGRLLNLVPGSFDEMVVEDRFRIMRAAIHPSEDRTDGR